MQPNSFARHVDNCSAMQFTRYNRSTPQSPRISGPLHSAIFYFLNVAIEFSSLFTEPHRSRQIGDILRALNGHIRAKLISEWSLNIVNHVSQTIVLRAKDFLSLSHFILHKSDDKQKESSLMVPHRVLCDPQLFTNCYRNRGSLRTAPINRLYGRQYTQSNGTAPVAD